MARYKITCCKDCEDRQPGCHGSCEKYAQEKAEYDETMTQKRKEYEIKMGLDSFLFDTIHNNTKRMHYRDKYRRSR